MPWPRPTLPGRPSYSALSQGLYQWVYHTHEDAQEAQGVPGEDPNGDGAREDDQPNSGNGTGGQHDRDAGGDQDLFCVPSSPSFSTPSALH